MILFLVVYNLLVVAGMLLVAVGGPRALARGIHPDLKALLPPLTGPEKRRALLWGAPLLLIMLGLPQGYLIAASLAGRDFWGLWLDGYLILMSFNLVDLLIVDWLILCCWTPKFVVLPGTEGHPAYKDYAFHAWASLRGSVLLVFVSLAMAGLASLW